MNVALVLLLVPVCCECSPGVFTGTVCCECSPGVVTGTCVL